MEKLVICSALSQAGSQSFSISRYKSNSIHVYQQSHRKPAFFQFLFVVKYHIFLLKGTPQLSYPLITRDAHRCSLEVSLGSPRLGLTGCYAGPAAVLCFWRRKT